MSIRFFITSLIGVLLLQASLSYAEEGKKEKVQVKAAMSSRDGVMEIREKSLLWYLDQALKEKERAEEARKGPPKKSLFKKIRKQYDEKTKKYEGYSRRLEARARKLEAEAVKVENAAARARERAKERLIGVEKVTKEAEAAAELIVIRAQEAFEKRKREVERWTILIGRALEKDKVHAKQEAMKLINTAQKLARITEEEAMFSERQAEVIRAKADLVQAKAEQVREKTEFMKRKD
ncbi:MAG: hypothetical protein ACI9S8_000941 [Chlamydiales bacterium]|jgi:hypothetical protein